MQILRGLGEYGVLGILVFVLIGWVIRLYTHNRSDARGYRAAVKAVTDRLSQEQSLRVSDAQRTIDVALKMQSEVISSVASIEGAVSENAKLSKLVETLVDQVDVLVAELREQRDARPNDGRR